MGKIDGVMNTTKDPSDIMNDPEIDAVLICSSTDTHSSLSLEAIKAGKHVFCEKPMIMMWTKLKKLLRHLRAPA